MVDIRVSVPVDKEKKDFWQEAARAQGLSFSDFVREALDLKAGFSVFFAEKIKAVAKKSRISESLVVENMLIDRLAYDSAAVEMSGHDSAIIGYFQFTKDGPVTGEVLFDGLRSNYIDKIKRERAAKLRLRKEIAGELDAKDQKWLDEYDEAQMRIDRGKAHIVDPNTTDESEKEYIESCKRQDENATPAELEKDWEKNIAPSMRDQFTMMRGGNPPTPEEEAREKETIQLSMSEYFANARKNSGGEK